MRSRQVLDYSSGTTGLPKGCMVTVYNIVAHCEQQRQLHDKGRQVLRARGEDISDTDAILAFLPFYHACMFPSTVRSYPRKSFLPFPSELFSATSQSTKSLRLLLYHL